MSEIIKDIEDVIGINKRSDSSFDDGFNGVKITTSEQEIWLLIEGGRNCCENAGYFMSEDKYSDFIDCELLSIEVVDTALKVDKLASIAPYHDGQIIFVNLNTSAGLLQFTAYNEQNGCYGHTVAIMSNQLKLERMI